MSDFVLGCDGHSSVESEMGTQTGLGRAAAARCSERKISITDMPFVLIK
jgi:hypothetical protein